MASLTSFACPPYVFSSRPVCGFHSLIFLSDPDVITYDPSTGLVYLRKETFIIINISISLLIST